jgi:predicted nucleotidyltransferase
VAATPRSVEVRSIAQGIADALPETVEEVVVTGSVSRGVADDISDIEILIVTQGELDLGECFSLSARGGLTQLGTWAVRASLLGLTELQAETVALARDGPNVSRAQKRLDDARDLPIQQPRQP